MTRIRSMFCWRLLNSLARANESISLELSGAWEPTDIAGASGFYMGTRSLDHVHY